jgi:hypothetical protein
MLVQNAADENTAKKIAEAWDDIDKWPRLTVDSFLRHNYASCVGTRVASAALFRKYRDAFFDGREDPLRADQTNGVLAYVRQLRDSMRLYEPLARGEWPAFKAELAAKKTITAWDKDRLHRLVRILGSERSLPFLLACAELGEEALASAVPKLERLEFRSIISGSEQNAIANMYFDFAALVHARLMTPADALSEAEAWVAKWGADPSFLNGLRERLVYGTHKQTNYIKHLLTTINDHLPWFDRGASGIPTQPKTSTWTFSVIQDEHIYPRNPAVPVSDEFRELTDTVGNQTFWGPKDNRDATNLPPSEPAKQEAYVSSEVELTKRIGNDLKGGKTWDSDAIAERSSELIGQALALYFLSDEAKARASELKRSRTKLFEVQEQTDSVWLVFNKQKSEYDDSGTQYHYPSRIPNGKQLWVGDTLILMREKQRGVKSKGIEEKPTRAFALAQIDSVTFVPDGMRRAHYSVYKELPDEIPITDPNGGVDPRNNKTNAIVRTTSGYLQALKNQTNISFP